MAGFVNHFRGTAPFYAACHSGYPEPLWDLLGRRAGLRASSQVLDLGCGPGTATIPLARRSASVTAVDADAQMLWEGRRAAAAGGVDNVRWVRETAEDFESPPGTYQLIVIASAFHWMDRTLVAAKCHGWLRTGGLLAILGSAARLVDVDRRQEAGPEEVLQASPFGASATVRVPCEPASTHPAFSPAAGGTRERRVRVVLAER